MIISFEEFCNRMQSDFRKYMSEQYNAEGYTTEIISRLDNFGINDSYLIVQKQGRTKTEDIPKISLNVMYDNFKSLDIEFDTFVKSLVPKYEKSYAEYEAAAYKLNENNVFDIHNVFFITEDNPDNKNVTYEFSGKIRTLCIRKNDDIFPLSREELEKSGLSVNTVFEEAINNLGKCIPQEVSVTNIGEENLAVSTYIIADYIGHNEWNLFGMDALRKIAKENNSNLSIYETEKPYKCIVMPTAAFDDLKECDETINEAKAFFGLSNKKAVHYNKDNDTLISETGLMAAKKQRFSI